MIDIRDYNRLRGIGFSVGDAYTMAQPAPAGDRTVAMVLVGSLILLFALGIVGAIDEYMDARDRNAVKHATQQHEATIDRLERVVTTCLNGGPINVSGEAFECSAGSLGVQI